MVKAVTPIPFVRARFFDRCGKPLSGGKVYSYAANTTTEKVTYKDPYGLTPNTNPIILDAAGEADIYLDGTYRIRITDRNDVLVNDVAKIGSWFSDNLQDTLDNISMAMTDALQPKIVEIDEVIVEAKNSADVQLANLQTAINMAYQAGAGANGWTAELITDKSRETQQQVNYNGGSKWHSRVGGYLKNERAVLANGDIVKSTVDGNSNNPNVDMTGWVFDKGAYRASWFADSESESDQSLALRNGYLKAVENGVPFIIDAVFNVDPAAIDAGLINNQKTAFEVVSNSVILFMNGGALKTIPNNKPLSSLMLIANNVENVYIFKPKLIGDRIEHTYVSGTNEWGYGLTIYESKNITVIEPDCSNFIGDGIYVGKVWGSDSENVPTNIFIDRPKIDRCRRNGIATTAWGNLKIMYPRITNCGVTIDGIDGTGPNAGIDVEPEKTTSTPVFRSVSGEIVSPYIENCGIGICTFNEIGDLYFEMLFSGKTTLKDCAVNTSLSNGASGTSGYLTIEDLYLSGTNNSIQAMWSGDGTNQLTISSVTHKSNSVGAPIVIGGHGSFVNKSIGNMKIHYNNSPHILVFYTIKPGTDLSEFTLSNTSITANSVIVHSIDATNTYTRFPKVNLSGTLIRGQTTFQEANISTVDYRGLSIIYLGANTGQNISLHGIASGSVAVKTPSNNSLKTISGLKLYKKNGLNYDAISTTTPNQEIDFTLGWSRDVIDRNTFGWDGLSIENGVTFNPDPIPAKSTISTSVTLPGVKIGDYVAASFSSPDSRVCLSCSVSANDTVTVFFSNITDSIVDLPSGTLRVKQI